ncbi:hypothetical protein AB0F71_23555 [Kitasatospora sp. NPDC028055]|uniref:hypothetical protein n=1 Tax=unclassified Kitasatospora TaxID=2633591 RepID=UPI0033EEEC12
MTKTRIMIRTVLGLAAGAMAVGVVLSAAGAGGESGDDTHWGMARSSADTHWGAPVPVTDDTHWGVTGPELAPGR